MDAESIESHTCSLATILTRCAALRSLWSNNMYMYMYYMYKLLSFDNYFTEIVLDFRGAGTIDRNIVILYFLLRVACRWFEMVEVNDADAMC